MERTLNNQYTHEFPAITDVTNRFIDRMVVMWSDSSDMTFKAAGFQVTQAVRHYERIASINSIGANTTVDFGHFVSDGHTSLGGSDEDDRLRVNGENEQTILEFGLGIEQASGTGRLLVGVQNPAGDDIQGAQGDDKTRTWGESGLGTFSERDAIEWEWTRTTDSTPGVPTTATAPHPHQGHIRWDSESNGDNELHVAFEEVSGNSFTPNVHALGLAYHVTPVHAPGKVKNLLLGDPATRVVQYGGWENTSPDIPDQWGSSVVEIDSETARSAVPNPPSGAPGDTPA